MLSRTLAHVHALGVISLAAACGAPPPPPEPEPTPEEREAIAREERRSAALALCLERIAPWRGARTEVLYSLPPSTTASLRVLADTIPNDPPDVLRARHELRDDRGQEIGVTTWVCADGLPALALERVMTETTTFLVHPPLPSIPLGDLDLDHAQDGSTALAVGARATEQPYRYEVRSEPGAPPLALLSLSASWRRVFSRLEIDLGDDTLLIETETLWALTPTELIAAERVQRESSGGRLRERREVAEVVGSFR